MLSVLLSFSSVQTSLAKWVTSKINKRYDTEIHIDRLDLSSIRTLKLKSVLIKDHKMDTLISAGSIETSILNYRNLFRTDLEFGEIELKKGIFNLRTHKNDTTNNLTLFIKKFSNKDKKASKPFKMSSTSIKLEDVNFTLYNENRR